MNKKPFIRLLAAMLCAMVLLAGCANPMDLLQGYTPERRDPFAGYRQDGGWEWDEDVEQRYAGADYRYTIPYSEMEYTRPDVEAMKQTLRELAEAIESAGSFEELLELDYQSGEVWSEFNTMFSLAMLGTYQDYTDEFWQEEYSYLLDASVELETINDTLNRAIVNGPYAEDYREYAGEYIYNYLENSLLLNAPEVEGYKQEREQLSAQYTKDLAGLTVEVDGVEYTKDDIYLIEDYEQYLRVYAAFYDQNVSHFAEIYLRMMELDKLTAETLGFASPADMYYLSYSRDYTPAEALAYCEKGRGIFAWMVPEVLMAGYYGHVEADLDEAMETIPSIMAAVDGELAQAWEHMTTYGLYDFEARENKQSGIGFTTSIAGYDAPFSYSYFSDDFSSVTTIIHEFGHYYDNWLHYDTSVVSNIDIAEIYSQALEALTQPFYGMLTDQSGMAIQQNLSSFIQAITYQMMLEEFQLRAYELESPDVDSLSALYTGLLESYGYGMYSLAGSNGYDNSWFEVTHMFDYPFYTISYATSATTALQLWSISQNDWAGAVDLYMDLMHADQNQPFVDLIESVGLKSPFAEGVLEDIADIYVDLFGLDN